MVLVLCCCWDRGPRTEHEARQIELGVITEEEGSSSARTARKGGAQHDKSLERQLDVNAINRLKENP